ncbi:ATP12 family chaperone protein [Nitrospirillum iridis]|uniref:Chaperone required for assembly of F1-ATPase n=1 Tax=Nitrospirillum iridis TaxID=765888 RepID=A0A7X0AUR7_9PROT|nr:ATP12 family protein [Nitrospirillum iridis]MBB6250037.1 chaperone required for assembly of F1-ATPase [Nitrospirillum iridis]
MKRIYKTVAVVPGAAGGWQVLLDARVLKSPAKADLVLPTEALAQAVAAEWEAQGDTVVPDSMPMMQLASTCVDRVGPQRAVILDSAAAYGGTDLLCYRAAEPAKLVERQARAWQPLLDWAVLRYDALLHTTTGIIHRAQDPSALNALKRALEELDDWQLTGVQNVVALTGSLILGLALFEGRIDGHQAFELAELDESFQIERWGEDDEAKDRRQSLRADLLASLRYLDLLRA